MIIALPNGEERKLDNDIPLSKKIELCENLIEEFDEYITSSWKNHKVSYFLNGLANYICWHKEEDVDWDKHKGILSNSREKQMERTRYHGRYRNDTVFTDLNKSEELKIFGEMTIDA